MKLSVFSIIIIGGVIIGGYLKKEELERRYMGGRIHRVEEAEDVAQVISNGGSSIEYYELGAADSNDKERYYRPSQVKVLKNPYESRMFDAKEKIFFGTPQEVIYAFYGILENVSSEGEAAQSYETAYSLLSEQRKEEISYEVFLQSFEGIEHISLLQFASSDTRNVVKGTRHYLVELEVIEGIGAFTYYYGIITAKEQLAGWYVDAIDLIEEEWPCKSSHGWKADALSMIEVASGGDFVIEDCKGDETKGESYFNYYVTDGTYKYRLDFTRLANGVDLLLNWYRLVDGKYELDHSLDKQWGKLVFNLEYINGYKQ